MSYQYLNASLSGFHGIAFSSAGNKRVISQLVALWFLFRNGTSSSWCLCLVAFLLLADPLDNVSNLKRYWV